MKGPLKILLHLTVIGPLAMAFVALVLPYKTGAATLQGLPDAKCIRPALHLDAKEVPAFIDQSGGPAWNARNCLEAPAQHLSAGADARLCA